LVEKIDENFYYMKNSQSGNSDFKIPISRVTSIQRYLIDNGVEAAELNKFAEKEIITAVESDDWLIHDTGYVLRLEKKNHDLK